MNKKMICIAAALAIALLSVFIGLAVFNAMVRIPSTGKIKAVGLECDTDLIDWGMVEPNGTKPFLIHVKPNGTASVTLALNTSAWIPANASDYLSLSWNYTGAVLEPDIWVAVELYLYVSPTTEGIREFSFDIIIVAIEV